MEHFCFAPPLRPIARRPLRTDDNRRRGDRRRTQAARDIASALRPATFNYCADEIAPSSREPPGGLWAGRKWADFNFSALLPAEQTASGELTKASAAMKGPRHQLMRRPSERASALCQRGPKRMAIIASWLARLQLARPACN